MWIEFTKDKSYWHKPRVVQEFKAGQKRNLPHEMAESFIAEGVAKRTKGEKKAASKPGKVVDEPVENETDVPAIDEAGESPENTTVFLTDAEDNAG